MVHLHSGNSSYRKKRLFHLDFDTITTIQEVIVKGKLTSQVVETLNRILEMELAGAIHYTHYSFMVSATHASLS
jgi:hypothetical protein